MTGIARQTAADAQQGFARGARGLMCMSADAANGLDAAVEADPGHPGARALRAFFGHSVSKSWSPRLELAAISPERYEVSSPQDRLLVDAARTPEDERPHGDLLDRLLAYVADRRDAVALGLLAFQVGVLNPSAEKRSALRAVLERHAQAAEADAAPWRAWLGVMLQNDGHSDRAETLLYPALSAAPENAVVAHALAHALMSRGAETEILELLTPWLSAHFSPAMSRHLQWHRATALFNQGRDDEVRSAFDAMAPGYAMDTGRLLWACRLGNRLPDLVYGQDREFLRYRIRLFHMPLHVLGVAMCLAACGDTQGLDEILQRCKEQQDPGFTDGVAAWARALRAVLLGSEDAPTLLAQARASTSLFVAPDGATGRSLLRLLDQTLSAGSLH